MREPSGVIARSRSPPVMVNAPVPAAEMVVRVTRPAVGRTTSHTPAPTTAEATNAAATGVTTRRQNGGGGTADAAAAGDARSALLSRTNSAVDMLATRRRRSLPRHVGT